MNLERLMFKKVEVWVIGLLCILFFLGLIFYGIVLRNELIGSQRFGVAGKAAAQLASMPSDIRSFMRNDERMTTIWGEEPRHMDSSGWTMGSVPEGTPLSGYLLLSRYDGAEKRHRVDFVDLSDLSTLHTWWPDAETIFAGLPVHPAYHEEVVTNRFFRAIHPVVFPNGDLLIKDHYTPAARIGPCGSLRWVSDEIYHHSAEMDPDGLVWMPIDVKERFPRTSTSFLHDGIIALDEDGNVVHEASLPQLFVDAGWDHYLWAMRDGFDTDPLHLNDVQPVLEDGPNWRKGDVLLSMRHKSMVALYRPANEALVWYQVGPWAFQHDVDIVGPDQLSIFDNNTHNAPRGPRVDGANRIVLMDVSERSFSFPFEEALTREEVKTISEGLHEQLPAGRLLVEEENHGRIVIFNADGSVAATFVNRPEGDSPYRLGWSRFIPDALGREIAANLDSANCS